MRLKPNEPVVCADGYTISIQASEFTYCSPRTTGCVDGYIACELGFPSEADELINKYAEPTAFGSEDIDYTATVYPYVPAHVIQALLAKHGGMVSGECPNLRGGEEE
jgi:hypothetical protein